jgi:toxin ParE1/3/4
VTLRVERHPDVERDILSTAGWMVRTSPDAAWRFLDEVEATMRSLGYMPGKGSPKQFRERRLGAVRSWPVNKFPKHLVFYEVRPTHVYVLAVMHGARRLRNVLRDRLA